MLPHVQEHTQTLNKQHKSKQNKNSMSAMGQSKKSEWMSTCISSILQAAESPVQQHPSASATVVVLKMQQV